MGQFTKLPDSLPKSNITPLTIVTATSPSIAVTVADDLVRCDASLNPISATLPTAVGNSGKVLHFKKTDGTLNIITVTAASGEAIDGALFKRLTTQYQSLIISSTGSGWDIL